MRFDFVQTVVAAAILGLLWMYRSRLPNAALTLRESSPNAALQHEGFVDDLKVIPLELSLADATTGFYNNIDAEIKGYLKPVVNAINRLSALRPKLTIDKTLVQTINTINKINTSGDVAAVKLMKIAEALPSNVDIYKSTYDTLIHFAVNEYEIAATPASGSGSQIKEEFLDITKFQKNPTKTINEYNRISNTRAQNLEEQGEAIKSAAHNFEVAFARLQTLLNQTK